MQANFEGETWVSEETARELLCEGEVGSDKAVGQERPETGEGRPDGLRAAGRGEWRKADARRAGPVRWAVVPV